MTRQQRNRHNFFEKYVFRWMRNDIRKALDADANKLAALGLVSYTEVLGGLLKGTLGLNGRDYPRARFDAFFKSMGDPYDGLVTRSADVFGRIRNQLAHSYFWSESGSGIERDMGWPCAVQIVRDRVRLDVSHYARDFFSAARKYRDVIVFGVDRKATQRFETALSRIRVSLP